MNPKQAKAIRRKMEQHDRRFAQELYPAFLKSQAEQAFFKRVASSFRIFWGIKPRLRPGGARIFRPPNHQRGSQPGDVGSKE